MFERGGDSERSQKGNRRTISKEPSSSLASSPKRGKASQHDFLFRAKNKRLKREPPSREAVQLSNDLKKLSRAKKLNEALALFWNSSNSNIRDGHHTCIMVDIAARCGNITVSYQIILDAVIQPDYTRCYYPI